ncbi:MAG: tripartite tricarboxylate transporter substrate binding protein [Burkholderiales bacterium]|nr:tripartite tricarboxylate transporter substrate binding protein [Burkholderiales bacterium]
MRVFVAAAMLAACVLPATATAQEWPVKAIRLVVPFPPGQGADIVGRVLAERLTAVLGQQVVVENRPGAGSMVGTAFAAKAPGDGYTLLIGGTSAIVINPHLYADPGYDTLRDFAPVSNIASLPMLVCVNPSFPARGIQDLIKIARQRPGEITYGSSGSGSTHHLIQAMIAADAKIRLTHVPYKGSTASMTDLMAGRIAMLADTMPAVMTAVRSGKARPIAVTSIKRSPFFPDVPTLDEQGLKGFDAVAWAGLFATAGTPAAVLDRLNQEVVKALETPAMQKRFQDLSMIPIGDSRADFARFVKTELARWGQAVKVSGAKVE